jgi:hypothetical protein
MAITDVRTVLDSGDAGDAAAGAAAAGRRPA